VDAVASAPAGTRNDTLNRAALNLYQLADARHLNPEDVHDQLLTAAQQAGLPAREAEATIRSGMRGAGAKPRQAVPDPDQDWLAPIIIEDDTLTAAGEDGVDVLEAFWTSRPILAHIRQAAYAAMCSPWAVLGASLAEAAARIPTAVVLPPTIGGEASPNLLINLVGPSGAGKGMAQAVATQALRWPGPVAHLPIGTGEGIGAAYAHPATKTSLDNDEACDSDGLIWERWNVIFTCPEIDALAAQSKRQGATVMPQLRAAFSGEQLGFAIASRDRRVILPEHAYRFALVAGVQPGRGAFLLDDADGGTPQRFCWLPATDPTITDQPPQAPVPLTIPTFNTRWLNRNSVTGRLQVPICDQAVRDIRSSHAARARGEGGTLDGHALQVRLKVGLALAALEGRAEVNDQDWWCAGVVMQVSDYTRAGVQGYLRAQATKRREAAVLDEINRSERVSDAAWDKKLTRVRGRLIHGVETRGPITTRDLRHLLASRDKDAFDDALHSAEDLKTIVFVDGQWWGTKMSPTSPKCPPPD